MSTRMAGPPEAMALESAFLGRLQQVVGWRIDGDRLHLIDAAGAPLMILERSVRGPGA
jgi:heat shock protein HslJ